MSDFRSVLGTRCAWELSTYLYALLWILLDDFSLTTEQLASRAEEYKTENREASVSLIFCLQKKYNLK